MFMCIAFYEWYRILCDDDLLYNITKYSDGLANGPEGVHIPLHLLPCGQSGESRPRFTPVANV